MRRGSFGLGRPTSGEVAGDARPRGWPTSRRGKGGEKQACARATEEREAGPQERKRRESGLRPNSAHAGKKKKMTSGQREGGEFSSFLFPNPFLFLIQNKFKYEPNQV